MKKFKKLTAVLMSASFVFLSFGVTAPQSHAESLSSLKDRQSEIQAKIDDSEEKLEALKEEMDAKEKIVNELNIQLSNLSDEYENVQAQKNSVDKEIDETEQKIESLNAEITQKDAEIDQTIELFCHRMRANYISGGTSTLEILTNSSSLSVFLNRLELLKRVTEGDQQLVDVLNKEIEELNESKSELETEKQKLVVKQNELQEVEADIQSTLNEIETKSQEVEARLAELDASATEIEGNLEDFNDQEKKIKAAIAAINANSSKSVVPSVPSSGFMFPIGYSAAYISSGFGYRSASISGNSFHGGIDITGGGIYGQPVYASRAGTVIVAEHYSNSGYGHYVMLDHGDGYQTLYGHCSSVAVNEGAYVSQGQVIAYVGSTGNSTGPHLHFEVRYNNTRVNPLAYVSM